MARKVNVNAFVRMLNDGDMEWTGSMSRQERIRLLGEVIIEEKKLFPLGISLFNIIVLDLAIENYRDTKKIFQRFLRETAEKFTTEKVRPALINEHAAPERLLETMRAQLIQLITRCARFPFLETLELDIPYHLFFKTVLNSERMELLESHANRCLTFERQNLIAHPSWIRTILEFYGENISLGSRAAFQGLEKSVLLRSKEIAKRLASKWIEKEDFKGYMTKALRWIRCEEITIGRYFNATTVRIAVKVICDELIGQRSLPIAMLIGKPRVEKQFKKSQIDEKGDTNPSSC